MNKSTIFIGGWHSPKFHGQGRRLTIMARPRSWEHGSGCVRQLTPKPSDLDEFKAGTLSLSDYKKRYEQHVHGDDGRVCVFSVENTWMFELSPGQLTAVDDNDQGSLPFFVADGDTLCCGCSRDASLKGECHRAWAAEMLVEAGWNVVIEGTTFATFVEMSKSLQNPVGERK